MLSENLAEAINKQINLEFYSAYAYLAMSAHFEGLGLPGAAQWMRAQSREEVVHAMKFFDFLNDRGEQVLLEAIEAPKIPHNGSVREMFEQGLAGEEAVTSAINDIYTLAVQERDYPTQVMLQWFIEEQVEEEKSINDVLDQVKLIGDDKSALFFLDRELGQRQEEEEEA